MAQPILKVTEHDEQKDFINEVHLKYGNCANFVEELLFSVPNGMWLGGDNKFALMAKFKAEGFRKGVADLIYLQPRGEYNCLAIEMKAKHMRNVARAVTEDQAAFLAAVNGNGGLGEVCYGAEEAIGIFDLYMAMEPK